MAFEANNARLLDGPGPLDPVDVVRVDGNHDGAGATRREGRLGTAANGHAHDLADAQAVVERQVHGGRVDRDRGRRWTDGLGRSRIGQKSRPIRWRATEDSNL